MGTSAIAAREGVGRALPTRLAVRLADEPPPREEPLAISAEAPLAPGETRLGPLEVRVELEAGEGVATLRPSLRNAGARPVYVESAILGFRWKGCGAGALRFLRHGWQSWSYTGSRDLDATGEHPFPSGAWLRGLHHAIPAPAADRAGWHESDLVTAIGASPSGPTLLLGALERGRCFGVVYARRDGEDVLAEIELRLDARLDPAETRDLEPVRIALGTDASCLLETYAEALGRQNDARVASPFVFGWCSWYHFFHHVTEDDVLRNLEALAGARAELPVGVVQLDDGYQRAVGDWLDTNAKFPRGLAPLAADIRKAGFSAGLWTAPFCVVAESEIFAKHSDWLLRENGEPFRGLVHPQWASDASVYVLDPSREEVTAHLRELFRTLVELGFSYHKLDFLYAAAMRAEAHDPRASRAERLRRGLEAVREGAGEEAYLLGCGCPLGAAVGVVDGMRIGPDVAPTWLAEPPVPIPGIEEAIPSTRSAIRSVVHRVFMHRRLWQNDPDCLMARARDTKLAPGERRALAAAIAGTGGVLVFSDDVPQLSDGSRALLRETLDAARAVDGLGLPARAQVPDPLSAEIPGWIVARDAEGGYVTALNTGDEAAVRHLDLEARRLTPLGGAPEWRIGGGVSPAETGEALDLTLAPRDAALLRLRRAVPLAVFCDFDGTFSVQDVGSTLAQRHAGPRRPEVWARYERGELTAWDYNMEILNGLPVSRAQTDAFLRTVDLDPGARELLAWCEERGVPFRVLSDGFDYNLNRLQQLHRIRFAYVANHLEFDRGAWRIAGGSPDPSCGCGTGVCKRGRIDAFRARVPGVTAVHIGNGRVSDTCGALAADVAFAKGSLAEELARRGAPFESFETLRDVLPALERLLDRSR